MLSDFIVIGENIHTTRAVRRTAPAVGTDELGRVAIEFADEDGTTRWLPIPEAEQRTMEYEEGRIKHVRAAVRLGMQEGDDAGVAVAYLRAIAAHQIEAGAAFLDINVDEVSLRLPEQIEAMRVVVSLAEPLRWPKCDSILISIPLGAPFVVAMFWAKRMCRLSAPPTP